MSDHSIILEPFKGNKTRHTCPNCDKRHEFSRYLNLETGDYIADHVGRCNREVNCGYHYSPKQYYLDNPTSISSTARPYTPKPRPAIIERPIEYLPAAIFEKSLAANYKKNHFHAFLVSLFGQDVTNNILHDYFIGTSKHWPGATVFWQADIHGKLRQAKIMLYNPDSGRRVKGEQDCVYFAGKSILNNYDANLVQCFYGEYLLTVYPQKKVAIVESEKTAIISSVYFPSLIWLATGGSHGCKWTSKEVSKVLDSRQVILFPDLGFYEKWSEKAQQVMSLVNCKIAVSDLLEKNATDEQRLSGWDLADFLLMNRDTTGWAMSTQGYPLFWDINLKA